MNENYVTYKPVAEFLGCSVYQVKKLWKEGIIKEAKMAKFHDFGETWEYPLFSLDKIKENEDFIRQHIKTRKSHIRKLDITPENIAEALYVINKSAKKSRDTAERNYLKGKHGITALAKERKIMLYEIKDKVLKKALELNWAKITGYHIQEIEHLYKIPIYKKNNEPEKIYTEDEVLDNVDNYLQTFYSEDYWIYNEEYEDKKYEIIREEYYFCGYEEEIEIEQVYLLLIEFCNFTFHIPVSYNKVSGYPFLGKIDKIPAEPKIKTKIKYTEALNLLNDFIKQENKKNELIYI